ncbi:TerC/Alx family metal homeostasis membrane protein [Flavobacterium tegetincola]|uniref:TerC/Alx family metal homeostasis membrane protein n=1 Tax=Flavobacterium tegetincola TaxID=150172 RepID=UPI0004285F9E|nr:TerC/Alx family metal homeostasis membrane protein [Flavobacterium tegetincola]
MEHPLYVEHPWLIALFAIVIVVMLLLDLGVFNKNSHEISNKEALIWSAVWIGLSMGFSAVLYNIAGPTKFFEFQSAYWIEKALSVDNLFVFIMVFKFFDVANQNKHKILFWGIVGALILRAIFIFSGAYLIRLTYLNTILGNFGIEGFKYNINIIMTFFGLFLVYAGIKSWSSDEESEDTNYNKSKGAQLVRKIFKVTDEYDGDKFFTIKDGKRVATKLFLVLAVIEFTDLLFAVDSIPAIFAISDDPFILYTSNIFAILGLRALFFLLDNFLYMFSMLKYGLAIILTFIGLKMIVAPFYHVESVFSLIIIGGILIGSVLLSALFAEKS